MRGERDGVIGGILTPGMLTSDSMGISFSGEARAILGLNC